MSKNKCRKVRKKKRCTNGSSVQAIGFVMLVFGIITVCAFFLPMRYWILLLGILLFYCGIRLYCDK